MNKLTLAATLVGTLALAPVVHAAPAAPAELTLRCEFPMVGAPPMFIIITGNKARFPSDIAMYRWNVETTPSTYELTFTREATAQEATDQAKLNSFANGTFVYLGASINRVTGVMTSFSMVNAKPTVSTMQCNANTLKF